MIQSGFMGTPMTADIQKGVLWGSSLGMAVIKSMPENIFVINERLNFIGNTVHALPFLALSYAMIVVGGLLGKNHAVFAA
jgi:hypothetical protein